MTETEKKSKNIDELIKQQLQKEFENELLRNEKTSETEKSPSFDFEVERRKRDLYLQEKNKYFEGKKGYVKIVNSIGETEWIKESELKKRDGYLNFEHDLDDADTHKSRLAKKYVITLIFLGVFIVYLVTKFWEKSGYIEVQSNITGAQIFLDNHPTGLETNNILEEVPEGEHVLSIYKKGYVATPESLLVSVIKDTGITVEFKLDSLIVDLNTPVEGE